jgi:predicted nucleotidyltransferase
MKTIEEIKENIDKLKPYIKKEYMADIVGIFGSYARGEQTENSDVDIPVIDEIYRNSLKTCDKNENHIFLMVLIAVHGVKWLQMTRKIHFPSIPSNDQLLHQIKLNAPPKKQMVQADPNTRTQIGNIGSSISTKHKNTPGFIKRHRKLFFYFGSKLIFRKNVKESLILAIGSASVSKILIFTIILLKYFNTDPIYPSTSSIITLIVVVIYGVYLGKTTESEKRQVSALIFLLQN